MALSNNYNAADSEKKWQQFWDQEGIYAFDEQSDKETFSIDTPPPTVSGKLHIGHVFSYTQAEIVARYQRMLGKNVMYPFGFDDNGLPTEILTEREKGIKGSQMPRAEFVKNCEEVSEKYRAQFKDLWQSLGFSCAWESAYSTISEKSQRISQRSFLDLLERDKVKYNQSPTLWCTKCQTSFAQAEVDDVNKGTIFNYLNFKSADGEDIPIATTRPELLPGCAAMFIHPENEKYKHLIGQDAIVPLFGHKVKILADEKADPEKGTGIVMCCTFGDVTDIDWWREHDLEMNVCFSLEGIMNERACEFEGLTIDEARAAIIAKLKEENIIFKQEDLAAEGRVVNTHERCGTPVEYLPTKQWFIKVVEHKEELLAQGEKVNWFPSFMGKRYRDWVDNLGWDWAISRQRYFGVPIPVWYAPDGTIVPASPEQLPVNPLVDKPLDCKGFDPETLIPEADVLDTWATSSSTPELNSRWGEEDELPQIRPMSMRPQAHDIIRTWAFYTIVKSYFHFNDVPWKDAVISGHVIKKDQQVKTQKVEGKAFARKSKISKSKDGDRFSPLAMIANHGADQIRYWASSGTLGTDIAFDEDEIEGSSKLLTKLWNSTRFAEGFLENFDASAPMPTLTAVDKWVLTRFDEVIKAYHKAFEKYEFFPARNALEQFFWSDFCDNYIEMVKHRLYGDENAEDAKAARWTLYNIQLGIIKLFAPYMPHICEEIYQDVFREREGDKSVHISLLPSVPAEAICETGKKAGALLLELVTLVRTYKSKHNYSMKLAVETLSVEASEEDQALIDLIVEDLCGVCKIAELAKVAVAEPWEGSNERFKLAVKMDEAALLRTELVADIKKVILPIKQANGLKSKSPVKAIVVQADAQYLELLQAEPGQLKAAARSEEVHFNQEGLEYTEAREGLAIALIIE